MILEIRYKDESFIYIPKFSKQIWNNLQMIFEAEKIKSVKCNEKLKIFLKNQDNWNTNNFFVLLLYFLLLYNIDNNS